MSDQCKHCTVRGDLQTCSNTVCGHHDSWCNQALMSLIAKLEGELSDTCKYMESIGEENSESALAVLEEAKRVKRSRC